MTIFKKDYYNDEILNYFNLNKPICNDEIISDIIENSENEIFNYYSKNDAIKIIELYSDEIYYKIDSNDEYISLFNSYDSEIILNVRNDIFKIASKSYNVLTLLKLFDELYDEFKPLIDLYKNIDIKSYIYELYDEILSELYNKNLFKHYFKNVEYKSYESLLDAIKFKINISDNNLLSNNYLTLNDELIDSEIDSILINDLEASVLDYINTECYYSDSYYELVDIYILNNINKYSFFESIIIEFLNDEFSLDMKYSYENKPDYFYKNNIEYYLEISLYDILKLNEFISESESYDMIFNLNDSSNDNIFKLIENVNNSFDSDSFFYGIIENISESLYESYYESYYYELYKINSKSFNFKKIDSIYELIEITLNEFKHYNLNNSFVFSDELYELN